MENVYEFILNLITGNGILVATTVFVFGQIIKKTKAIDNKYIPLLGGTLGLILGILIPELYESKNLITSACLGLTSGWAATGGYETVKQLIKKGDK